MEWRIDDLELIRDLFHHGLVDGHGHDVLKESLVRLRADDLNEAGGRGLLKTHELHIVENVELAHLCGDGGCVLRRELCAVGPVDLVAVVLAGIVAGGDVDARRRAVVHDGKGELRRRAQGVEYADADAIGGHDARGLARKALAVQAAVVADDDALLAGFFALGLDDRGERLGGPADDMDVHPVKARCHDAAQARRAELQRSKKAAFYLFLILGDGGELFPLLLAKGGAVQPVLVFFLIAPLHLLTLLQVCSSHPQAWSPARKYPRPRRSRRASCCRSRRNADNA